MTTSRDLAKNLRLLSLLAAANSAVHRETSKAIAAMAPTATPKPIMVVTVVIVLVVTVEITVLSKGQLAIL